MSLWHNIASVNSCQLILATSWLHILQKMLLCLKLSFAEEFEALLNEAQKWAKSVGYNENDVDDIVKSVRKKKRV